MKVMFNVQPNKGPRLKWTSEIPYESQDNLLRALRERVTPARNYIAFLPNGNIEIGVEVVGTYKVHKEKNGN